MKRTLTYFAVAVFLGITLTLVPLVVLAEIKPPENHARPLSLSIIPKMRELEGYSSLEKQGNAWDDVTVLAVGFIIACIGYMVFKRKTTRHGLRWGELY